MDQRASIRGASIGDIGWEVTSGLTDYAMAVEVMQARAAAIRAGSAGEQVWLVEHPPIYTGGTSARESDVLGSGTIPTLRTGRGGQWTYHGPGQRIAYVMLDLTRAHGMVPARDVRGFVASLERWLILTLAVFGIHGETRDGRVGIWIVDPMTQRESKIAAIGVRVSRWVSFHGVALNVAPNLDHYQGIIPCGIRQHGVTSMAALGVRADMAEIDAALRTQFDHVFGSDI
ncbi:MAG: lipoyl(octanoyl) transferase LipB [Acidiphilium sp.]